MLTDRLRVEYHPCSPLVPHGDSGLHVGEALHPGVPASCRAFLAQGFPKFALLAFSLGHLSASTTPPLKVLSLQQPTVCKQSSLPCALDGTEATVLPLPNTCTHTWVHTCAHLDQSHAPQKVHVEAQNLPLPQVSRAQWTSTQLRPSHIRGAPPSRALCCHGLGPTQFTSAIKSPPVCKTNSKQTR